MFGWLNAVVEYIDFMRYLVVILAFVLAINSFYKASLRKDYTLIAVGVSRLFVSALYICIIINPDLPPEFRVLITTGFVLIFMTDFISNFVFYITKHYRADIEVQRLRIALSKIEAKNHFILEESPAGIYQYSCLTQKFIYVNPAFAKLFGLTPTDLIGMSVYAGMPQSEVRKVKQSILDRIAQKQDVVSQVLHITTTSGEKITLGCTGKVVYNGEASVLGYAVVLPS